MIYFIQDSRTLDIKIGYTSRSVMDRLATLQTGNAGKLEVIACMPGEQCDETSLHVKFAGDRIGGEWFRPSPALLRHLAFTVVGQGMSDEARDSGYAAGYRAALFESSPVIYNGKLFQSRLKARWAVFFDQLKVGWEYDPAGNDFWISPLAFQEATYPQGKPPVPGWWVKISPTILTKDEERKCRELVASTRHVVYAIAGGVGVAEFVTYKWHPAHPDRGGVRERQDTPSPYFGDSFLFYVGSHASRLHDNEYASESDIQRAFSAAKAARF